MAFLNRFSLKKYSLVLFGLSSSVVDNLSRVVLFYKNNSSFQTFVVVHVNIQISLHALIFALFGY